MKPKISIWVSLLICLVLLVFGLTYGDVNGYADERAHVNALLEGDSGLLTVVGYRASDGLNLCVVAQRHLSGDPDVTALKNAAEALRVDGLGVKAVKAGDTALTGAFGAVAGKLKVNADVSAGGRDAQYLAMLTADFDAYGQSEIFSAYNKAASEFNRKLTTPVLGDVARFFGVKACELYE